MSENPQPIQPIQAILLLRDDLIATLCRFVTTTLSVRKINHELSTLEHDATPEIYVRRMLLQQDLDTIIETRSTLATKLSQLCARILQDDHENATVRVIDRDHEL